MVISSLNTESTPQVANAKIIENTATITIRLEDSALEGNVTLFLNSSTDSFIYVNMCCIVSITLMETTLGFPFYLAREERLELPTPGFGDQCSTN